MRVMQNTSHNTSILFRQSLEGGQFQKHYLIATKEIDIGLLTSMTLKWLDIGLEQVLHRAP